MPTLSISKFVKDKLDHLKIRDDHKSYDSLLRTLVLVFEQQTNPTQSISLEKLRHKTTPANSPHNVKPTSPVEQEDTRRADSTSANSFFCRWCGRGFANQELRDEHEKDCENRE